MIIKKVLYSCDSVGTILAIAISWGLYKSIWWAILHGFFGWFYVIYYACTR